MTRHPRDGFLAEIFASFQGEGARVGERHLFVRTAGCHLRCRYCDTPDALVRTADCRVDRGRRGVERVANPLSSETLRSWIVDWIAAEPCIDAVAVTGGEPLNQADFLAEVIGPARLPVPVLLETSGTLPRQFAKLVDFVDVVSMDIKPPSNTGERPLWHEHEEFLALAAQRDLYVKVLVDQGTDVAEIRRAAEMIGRLAPAAALFLQPISRPEGGVAIDGDGLERCFSVAREHIRRVRVVPQTHKMMRIA